MHWNVHLSKAYQHVWWSPNVVNGGVIYSVTMSLWMQYLSLWSSWCSWKTLSSFSECTWRPPLNIFSSPNNLEIKAHDSQLLTWLHCLPSFAMLRASSWLEWRQCSSIFRDCPWYPSELHPEWQLFGTLDSKECFHGLIKRKVYVFWLWGGWDRPKSHIKSKDTEHTWKVWKCSKEPKCAGDLDDNNDEIQDF